MSLAEGLLAQVKACFKPEELNRIPVTRICVGLHWTLVESLHVGLCHTYRGDGSHTIAGAGSLEGRFAWELAQRVTSANTLDATIGWAALKSLMPRCVMAHQAASTDVRTWVRQHGMGRTVSVIGRFPFAASLGEGVGRLLRFEMEPEEGELPASDEPRLLPHSHINVITASALINGTMDSVLDWGRRGANLVVGPSTPMSPWLLTQGVDMLCGVEVVDGEALFRSIREGVPGLRHMAGVVPVSLVGEELAAKLASWRDVQGGVV